MKEIRLWQILKGNRGKPEVTGYKAINQTETEKLLEDVLVESPELLIPGLKLIGRQTDTPGGPLDLLGVDEDGRLAIFELKRGTLTRDAVSQLIDYASFLSAMDPEELSVHISERSGKLGIDKIDNFSSWYQEQFARNLIEIRRPRLFLVGLGADERTRRMVSFLSEGEIDISLITFHGFEDDGKVVLARQVEVEARQQTSAAVNTKEGNLEKLKLRISKLEVSFYEDLAFFFQDKLSPAYQWPNQSGYSLYLPEITETGSQSNRVYVSLYLHDSRPGRVQLYFHPRAVLAAGERWKNFFKDIRGELTTGNKDGGAEIWIGSPEECEYVCSKSEEICDVIIQGWQEQRKSASLDINSLKNDVQPADTANNKADQPSVILD
jgi:hypothetical protein